MITQPLFVVVYPSALCAQIDPELWFPDRGGSNREAKALCHKCVHEAECLEDALARDERYGIYGGKSERERAAISRARKRSLVGK